MSKQQHINKLLKKLEDIKLKLEKLREESNNDVSLNIGDIAKVTNNYQGQWGVIATVVHITKTRANIFTSSGKKITGSKFNLLKVKRNPYSH